MMVASVLRYGSEVWFLNKVPARALESIQLGMVKSVLRVNRSTTDEFVRGEVGLFELERERDTSMLIWLGRVKMALEKRWIRRVFNMEWKVERKGGRSWKWKVNELLEKYRLQKEVEECKSLVKWKQVVKGAVEKRAIEDWREGVISGKKLGIYYRLKQEWGWEDYLNKA